MSFSNREEAARRIAAALSDHRQERPLVLAIARGAVPIGSIVASELGGDFDVALIGKFGAPFQAEFAVGVVEEGGFVYLHAGRGEPHCANALVERERDAQLALLRQRRRLYTPERARLSACGRHVIVVDDCILTGATMIAALEAIRQEGPSRLICAVPVATPAGLRAVRRYADEVVCLRTAVDIRSVRDCYGDCPPVADTDVLAVLVGQPE